MNCRHCKREAPDDAKVCPGCDQPLARRRKRAKTTSIEGTARADQADGGAEVSGVRVDTIRTQTTQFHAQHLHVHMASPDPALLAKVARTPTEVQPPANEKSASVGLSKEVGALRNSIDQALSKLDEAARTGHGGNAMRAGGVEMSRVDLLVKKGILLGSEADQMYFDHVRAVTASVQPGAPRMDDAALLANWPQREEQQHKAKEALAIFEEASRLEPANTEVLLHLHQATARVANDLAAGQAILFRLLNLLRDPKTDTERFHLAQTMYLGATSAGVPQPEKIRTARGMFEKLDRGDWVRACDDQLARHGGGAYGGFGGGFAPPPPPPAAFHPVGHWQVASSDGGAGFLEFRPDAFFQGSYTAGPFMGSNVSGRWGYDPVNRLLQVQGLVNGMVPFFNVLAILGVEGGMHHARDGYGVMLQMRRIA